MVPFILLIGAVGALAFYGYKQATVNTDAPTIDVTASVPNVPLLDETGNAVMIINTDKSTWPAGDKIWDFCHAIALAEGYEVANSVPSRLHNPGDISDGRLTYGSQAHDGSNVTTFPDDATGWQWLYNKISNALTGKSTVFKPTMTFWEFAQKYAGDSANWCHNVCNTLSVNETDVIGDWFNA